MQIQNNNEPFGVFWSITPAKRLMTTITGKCVDKQALSAAGDGSANRHNFPKRKNGKFNQNTKV